MDIRYTLKSMGVPIETPVWMIGDNQSVITSSTIPSSVLKKRHNFLSYHRVRSAIAHGILKFCYCKSEQNIADFLSKPLGYQQFWPLIKKLLFWRGKTSS